MNNIKIFNFNFSKIENTLHLSNITLLPINWSNELLFKPSLSIKKIEYKFMILLFS